MHQKHHVDCLAPFFPHSVFYKLLDELWTECEELMDKGISGTGSGFNGSSAGRLGSHGFIPTHNPPAHKLKDAVLKVGSPTMGEGKRVAGLAYQQVPGASDTQRCHQVLGLSTA